MLPRLGRDVLGISRLYRCSYGLDVMVLVLVFLLVFVIMVRSYLGVAEKSFACQGWLNIKLPLC